MEEFLIFVLGVGVLALVPAVPVLRRLGKIGVKGGLMVADAVMEPAATVGNNWREMVNEAKEETKAGGKESQAASPAAEPATDAGQPAPPRRSIRGPRQRSRSN